MGRGFPGLLVFAVVVTVLMTVPSSTSAVGPPGGIPWGYQMNQKNASLGGNVSLIIFGPGNGSVIVSVNVLPFNSTPPVEQYLVYLIGNATNRSVGNLSHQQVYRNISIPTKGLYVGTVQFCVIDEYGDRLGCSLVELTSGNYTQEQNQIGQLTQNVSSYNQRELSLFYLEQNQQKTLDIIFWVFIGGWAAVIAILVLTLTGVANRRTPRRVRQMVHGAIKRKQHIEFGDDWEDKGGKRPKANADRIYRGLSYPACLQCGVDQTKTEMLTHLLVAHGVSSPIEGSPGGDYAAYRPSVKLATAKREDDSPDLNVLRDRIDNIDVSDVPKKFGGKK